MANPPFLICWGIGLYEMRAQARFVPNQLNAAEGGMG